MAASATTEPDERSMPVVMITWVTPIASRPVVETCRMMISSRLELKRKLWPRRVQPSNSKISAMPTITSRMLASSGSLRRVVLCPAAVATWTAVVMAICLPIALCGRVSARPTP
jgi:hypothetical protein